MGEVLEYSQQRQERTALEKADIINQIGKDFGISIEITEDIRKGKERGYSVDLENLEGGSAESRYLPIVIEAFESYLVSPVVKDHFANHDERSAWADKYLLPVGKDVWEYFKKSRYSGNMMINLQSGLRIYASYNPPEKSELARYVHEILANEGTPGGLPSLKVYRDISHQTGEKERYAHAFTAMAQTFLEKLRSEMRRAA